MTELARVYTPDGWQTLAGLPVVRVYAFTFDQGAAIPAESAVFQIVLPVSGTWSMNYKAYSDSTTWVLADMPADITRETFEDALNQGGYPPVGPVDPDYLTVTGDGSDDDPFIVTAIGTYGDQPLTPTLLDGTAVLTIINPGSLVQGSSISVGGVGLFTPAVDDLFVGFRLVIDEAWNGTTPNIDFGPADSVGVIQSYGSSGVVAADVPDTQDPTGDMLYASTRPVNAIECEMGSGTGGLGYTLVMNPFYNSRLWRVWVTSNGERDGDDPGATQGRGRLWISTVTPRPA